MTITQIQYFMALAEKLNFTKTANTLYIPQPYLSKRIAELESELNLTLFERDTHSVKLTGAGKILFSFFKKANEEYSSAYNSAALEQSKLNGSLTIGVLDYLDDIGINMVEILNDFSSRFPDTAVQVYQQAYQFRPERIFYEGFDLIFTFSDELPDVRDVEFSPIIDCTTRLYFSPRHPLARKKDLSPKDFEGEKFFFAEVPDILQEKKRILRDLVACGISQPKIVFVPTTSAVFTNVGGCFGVTVADEPVVNALPFSLGGIDLWEHTLGFMCRKDGHDPRISFLSERLSMMSVKK